MFVKWSAYPGTEIITPLTECTGKLFRVPFQVFFICYQNCLWYSWWRLDVSKLTLCMGLLGPSSRFIELNLYGKLNLYGDLAEQTLNPWFKSILGALKLYDSDNSRFSWTSYNTAKQTGNIRIFERDLDDNSQWILSLSCRVWTIMTIVGELYHTMLV